MVIRNHQSVEHQYIHECCVCKYSISLILSEIPSSPWPVTCHKNSLLITVVHIYMIETNLLACKTRIGSNRGNHAFSSSGNQPNMQDPLCFHVSWQPTKHTWPTLLSRLLATNQTCRAHFAFTSRGNQTCRAHFSVTSGDKQRGACRSGTR